MTKIKNSKLKYKQQNNQTLGWGGLSQILDWFFCVFEFVGTTACFIVLGVCQYDAGKASVAVSLGIPIATKAVDRCCVEQRQRLCRNIILCGFALFVSTSIKIAHACIIAEIEKPGFGLDDLELIFPSMQYHK